MDLSQLISKEVAPRVEITLDNGSGFLGQLAVIDNGLELRTTRSRSSGWTLAPRDAYTVDYVTREELEELRALLNQAVGGNLNGPVQNNNQ